MADGMDRMRALLSSYYGMQEDETAQEDERDINSSTFQPNVYVKELLEEKTLPELVTYSDQLGNETKTLDTNMQNLVYENYSKFIAATDTIRQMKTSVGSMDDRMGTLVKEMSAMTESSAAINAALQDNRSKIEKLVGVSRLLKKLEFLFELPVRLNRSIELEAYAQACKYYSMASGVLKRYDHVPSLHAIRLEADTIIGALREKLRGTLSTTGGGTTASQVIEAIRLLVVLEEPRAPLRDAYLSWQAHRLKDLLAPFQAEVGAVESSSGHYPDTPLDFISRLDAAVLDQFASVADTYASLFEDNCGEDEEGEEERRIAHLQLVRESRELFTLYFDVVKTRLGSAVEVEEGKKKEEEEGEEGEETKTAVEDETDGEAAGTSTPSAATPKPKPGEAVAAALQRMLSDVRAAGQSVRGARLGDLAAEAAEAVIRRQVDFIFDRIRKSMAEAMAAKVDVPAGSTPEVEGGAIFAQAPLVASKLQSALESALVASRPLVLAGMRLLPDMAMPIAALVQGQLMLSLMWLASAAECFGDVYHVARPAQREMIVAGDVSAGGDGGDDPYGGSGAGSSSGVSKSAIQAMRRRVTVELAALTPSSPATPLCLLNIACAMRSFGTDYLGPALDGILTALPTKSDLASLGIDYNDLVGLTAAIDRREVAQRFQAAAQHTLRQFIALRGNRLSTMVRKSLATPDWFNLKEPRDARLVVQLVLEEIGGLRRQVGAAFGEAVAPITMQRGRRGSFGGLGPGLGAVGARGGAVSSRQASRGLQLDIERLFSQKQRIISDVTFTVLSVVEAVMQLVFKSLVEGIRTTTFGRNGYQQIQVDVAVLKGALPHLLESPKALEGLLNEAVASAEDRCVEPTAMGPSIVQALSEAKLNKLSL